MDTKTFAQLHIGNNHLTAELGSVKFGAQHTCIRASYLAYAGNEDTAARMGKFLRALKEKIHPALIKDAPIVLSNGIGIVGLVNDRFVVFPPYISKHGFPDIRTVETDGAAYNRSYRDTHFMHVYDQYARNIFVQGEPSFESKNAPSPNPDAYPDVTLYALLLTAAAQIKSPVEDPLKFNPIAQVIE